MSTAQTLIERAYSALGVGGELITVSDSLMDEGLEQLISLLSYLENINIILSDDVNTVAIPSALADEVSEPVGSRTYLIYYLAAMLIPVARISASDIKIPAVPFSEDKLANQYRVHTIPMKVPSRLLPRGQGATTKDQSTFFQGGALDKDAD